MNRFRNFLRWLRAVALVVSGGLWWAKRQLRKSPCIVVLGFHRILGDTEFGRTHSLSGTLMRRATFEQLAAHVARRCDPVDISRAAPGQESSRLRIAFTFDDGWVDTHAIAFPIARAHGIPIAIFVCPGLLGLTSPFWPERVVASIKAARPTARDKEIEAFIESMKPRTPEERMQTIAALLAVASPPVEANSPDSTLSWEQIAEMDRAGVTIGAHTHTHQILTTMPESAARLEIRDSKTAIERTLNKRCDLFAYPNGNHSRQTRRLLAEAGLELAFTTKRGAWTAACDRLAIPRQNIAEDDVAGPAGRFSPAMFGYVVFWRAWRAMQAHPRG